MIRPVRFAAVCLLSLFAAARAEEPASATSAFESLGPKTQRLTLGEAIEMALRNNLEVQFDKVGVKVEQARTRIAVGVFDPVFKLEVSHESLLRPDITSNITSAESLLQLAQVQAIQDNTLATQDQTLALREQTLALQQNTRAIQIATGQPVSPVAPPSQVDSVASTERLTLPSGRVVVFDQDVDRFDASLSFRTPIGTQLALTAREAKIRSTFDGDPRTITPFYTAFGGIEVRQPLLKDFGPAANLFDVRSSRISERVAALNWEKSLSDAIATVISTYIDMLFAEADMRNKQDAIAADRKLAEQNQRRLELGFMSPIDVQQARAQVSLDQEQFILSKNLFLERQFVLRRLITKEYTEAAPAVYVPEPIPNLTAPGTSRDNLLVTAFRKRPDYNAAVTDAERQDLRLQFAKNQLWPSLDLVGTYGYNGLGEGWKDAQNWATSSQAPQWSVGVQFSMPLGGVQPRAQLDAVKGLREQALLKIKQSELTLTVDVDTALSRIELSRQRLETARNTRELNEEAVRIAYRRLEEGQYSSFDLIEQQRKLYDAKSRELAARADLNRSIVQLWQATGTVLENTGVTVVKPNRRGQLPAASRNGSSFDDKAIVKPAIKAPKPAKKAR